MERETSGGTKLSGLPGEAALAIWCDVDPENDDEFNDWYTHQHLPERVGVPGFLRGTRWGVPRGQHHNKGGQYFTLYEIETLPILASEPYLERLNNPTEWTRRILPLFRNGTRTACRITATQGQGIGGCAATVEFGPAGNAAGTLRTWITTIAMPKALGRHDMVGIRLFEPDEAITRAKEKTAEGKVAGDDALARWFLLLESTDADGLDAACDELCGPGALVTHGAADDIALNKYRLLVSLAK